MELVNQLIIVYLFSTKLGVLFYFYKDLIPQDSIKFSCSLGTCVTQIDHISGAKLQIVNPTVVQVQDIVST
jgi:hypothetical protein